MSLACIWNCRNLDFVFIVSPVSICLQISRLKMRIWREIDFLVKCFVWADLAALLLWYFVNWILISAVRVLVELWRHILTAWQTDSSNSYNTRQVKTRQFALPKARSSSGAKMIKYSAIEIWSKIPPEIKNKTCLALFLAEYKKYVLLSY